MQKLVEIVGLISECQILWNLLATSFSFPFSKAHVLKDIIPAV